MKYLVSEIHTYLWICVLVPPHLPSPTHHLLSFAKPRMYYQQLTMSVMTEVSTYNSLRHEQPNLYAVTVWSRILCLH